MNISSALFENIRMYQQYEYLTFQAMFIEIKTYTFAYQYVQTLFVPIDFTHFYSTAESLIIFLMINLFTGL